MPATTNEGRKGAVKTKKRGSSSLSQTRARTRLPANDLKWRKVDTTTEAFAGMDEGGGMMMLEELDDVDVEWEEDGHGGKVAKFIVS
jgi:ATP-dependent RNA helicase DDX24/MAK5